MIAKGAGELSSASNHCRGMSSSISVATCNFVGTPADKLHCGHQGQFTSHASGEFVALFPKPVSEVIRALSLHRMCDALSQSSPELNNFQIRIGIHAEASENDDTEAQRKCIAIAYELKERALHGNILVSRAV